MNKILNRIIPSSDIANGMKWEARALLRHYFNAYRVRSKFKGKRGLYVQVGCGDQPKDEWINIDLVNAENITIWDCRRGLPFDDQSVSVIFSEHMYEHLDRPSSTHSFLTECRRVLEPGGVLRVIVPDAEMYLHGYCSGSWDTFVRNRPLVLESGVYRDPWLGDAYRTKMEMVNAVFRQSSEHKFAYDAETLMLDLRTAGFENVVQQVFGESITPKALLDTPARAPESLYVEAFSHR